MFGNLPGKMNITVVAESKRSSACPNGATEQRNLNWKDTVVRSLLVEVCTHKTIKLLLKKKKVTVSDRLTV